MSRVAIIVLNWNGIEDTKSCLSSLNKQTYKNREVILVENGSTEKNTANELKKLKKKYPSLIVLENDQNLGFAGGVNTGIRYAM